MVLHHTAVRRNHLRSLDFGSPGQKGKKKGGGWGVCWLLGKFHSDYSAGLDSISTLGLRNLHSDYTYPSIPVSAGMHQKHISTLVAALENYLVVELGSLDPCKAQKLSCHIHLCGTGGESEQVTFILDSILWNQGDEAMTFKKLSQRRKPFNISRISWTSRQGPIEAPTRMDNVH